MSPPPPIEPRSEAVATDPVGWTSQQDYLLIDYYWTGKDSILGLFQDDYDIPNVKPVITRKRELGNVMFLVESTPDGKPTVKTYYVWNGVANVVCRIDGQTDLNSIYTAINSKNGYLGGLKQVKVYPKA